MIRSITQLTIFTLAFFIVAPAQQSGPQYYRSAVMNGNRIKTVFGNWGVIGQPNDTRPRGAWIHEPNGYIGDESFLVGLEFPIKDYNGDGTPDTVHSVISSVVNRPALSYDVSPVGDPWTFMPVETSTNPSTAEVANSSKSETWPSAWVQWNSIPGIGKVNGALEAYYQLDDQNDHRFDTPANNPYNTDFTGRSGQGIVVDVWYLQVQDPLHQDILFRVYDVRNISSLNYEKVTLGYVMGTYVGISGGGSDAPGEYDDDYSILFKKENAIIIGDYGNNCSRNPLWIDSVGLCGVAFIDAPNENGIGSYSYFAPSNQISLGNDESLWKRMQAGAYSSPSIVVNDTVPVAGNDGDFVYGSHYFSLDSGEVKRIASVVVFGYTNAEVLEKIKRARYVYQHNFDFSVDVHDISNNMPPAFSLSQNYPNPFNPSTTIEYQLPRTAFVTLKIYDVLGREVSTLVNEEKSAGIFKAAWDADSFSSGLYFSRMTAGKYSSVKKMILSK